MWAHCTQRFGLNCSAADNLSKRKKKTLKKRKP